MAIFKPDQTLLPRFEPLKVALVLLLEGSYGGAASELTSATTALQSSSAQAAASEASMLTYGGLTRLHADLPPPAGTGTVTAPWHDRTPWWGFASGLGAESGSLRIHLLLLTPFLNLSALLAAPLHLNVCASPPEPLSHPRQRLPYGGRRPSLQVAHWLQRWPRSNAVRAFQQHLFLPLISILQV